MIQRKDIKAIVEGYDKNAITIGVLGSHSALDICRGAKDTGFKTIVVCQKGREKTYAKYYRSRGAKGVVDDVLVLDKFSEITKKENIEYLQKRNTIFLPHRSFEVYVGFEKIENEFAVPIFGSRNLLRAEERYVDKNQYYLMEKGGIPYPKTYKSPDDIDRLVIVKVAEKERPYERAFFFASSHKEYTDKSQELILKGKITPDALKEAVIEEFIDGAQVNLNFFYSTLTGELELLGTDTRRQTNLDGILRLPAPQQNELLKYKAVQAIEAGHIACTVKESLLEQIFELGEKFVKVAKQEYPPGIIGPFALQCALTPGPPKESFVCFDISMRVQGSPGTKFTPYSEYLHGGPVSVGKRIGIEIKSAINENKLTGIVT
ncbi:MAG: 5-formaminoimidazole-4-carboxamide-1-(beta)-D-ribofuranosyl 5'-monophosphate synthetase [Candidatus Altiarchaeales archaeon IMC4]|nr:MAG: 5-formaminoimidazole-4-carboxamide-1-(beta)-D-ribofuranosyl 5'-monophosphate synthetase [Candidatus Altiarchaeales archaeon IMC4]